MKAGARLAASVLALLACSALALPTGHRWFKPSANGVAWPPAYVVYAHSGINNVPTGFGTRVLPVIQRAFAHWTAAEVGCTYLQVNYGGTFTIPSGESAVTDKDRVNRVIWLGGADWGHSNSTLGMTTTTWYVGAGQLFDADMEMNDNIPWKLGGAGQAYDVESIVTHEAGHFIGIDHTPQTRAVMTPYYTIGTIKVALDALDINDLCGIYPASASAGARGSPCGSDANCAAGLKCRGSQAAGSGFICTSDCGAGQACPAGTACQAAQSSGGAAVQACLVKVGSADLCRFCTSGQDCGSGICLTGGRTHFCSMSCVSDAQCGPGFSCEVDEHQRRYCVPVGDTCPIPQCTGPAQCPPGYGCAGGMCTATGVPGARCEVSRYCAPCTLCIGELDEAYCLGCCGGTSLGGACSACASAACTGGDSCESLLDGPNRPLPDKVCVPAGSGSCAPCVGSADCQAGLICHAGRCRSPCATGETNTCPQKACHPTTGGQGVCACPDEVVDVGQSCGQSGSTFRACSHGALCVGSPATCRAACVSGACGTGEACQVVSGRSVCVPTGGAGDAACAPCVNGSCSNGLTCLGGRCYPACDTQAPACDACVATTGTSGVCACADQRQSEGGACGLVAGIPFACAGNGLCVEGRCRLPCGASSSCSEGFTCGATARGPACIPLDQAPGGGTLEGVDGGGGGGGGGGIPVDTAGCGCTSVDPVPAWTWLALALRAAVRRRPDWR